MALIWLTLTSTDTVLAWCDHKFFLQIKTKQFYDHIMQKLVKTGKTQKSINNPMSSFYVIEENMELSHTYSSSCTAAFSQNLYDWKEWTPLWVCQKNPIFKIAKWQELLNVLFMLLPCPISPKIGLHTWLWLYLSINIPSFNIHAIVILNSNKAKLF